MPEFEEHQQFRQWWLLVILAVTAIAGWSPLIVLLLRNDDAPSPDPLWVVALVAVLAGVALPGWILYLRLRVTVDAEGVRVRYRGLPIDRVIPFGEITAFEAVDYRPVLEYGGWGVRWRGRGKIAYAVSGNEGVRMQLADGREVLVGSLRAKELAAAIGERVRR